MPTRTLLLWAELPEGAGLVDANDLSEQECRQYLWERIEGTNSYRPAGPRLHPSDVARFKMMG